MKKNNHSKLKIALFVGFVALALPAISKAQFIVYSDSFNQRTGNSIDATQVQNSANASAYGGTTGALWSVNSGDAVYAANKNQANLVAPNPAVADNATLQFIPKTGYVYTLTALLTPANNTPVDLGFYNTGSPTAYLQDSLTTLTLFGVPGNTGGIVVGSGGTLTLTLVLDTTGPNWTESVDENGVQVGNSFTFTTNPTINGVGFDSTGKNVARVANFELDAIQAVPEPSSYVSGLIVLGFLAFEIRRRRMAVQS